MGLLRKLLGKDLDELESLIEEPMEIKQPPKTDGMYNRRWLDQVALGHILEPSDDEVKIDKILDALNRRNGQCPCGGNGSQYKCPCVNIRERGICTCGLFKSIQPRKISGSTTASIKRND